MRSGSAIPLVGLFLCALVAVPAGAGPFQDLQATGSGPVVSNCPGRLVANCTTRSVGTATGTTNGTPVFQGEYDIRFDTGSTGSLNGWPAGLQQGMEQGLCFHGSHLGWLTAPNGDILRFAKVGTVCEEGPPGSPVHFNGTFRITGGTGQFATASGLGNIVITVPRDGSPVLVKMSGSIAY